MGYCLRKYSKKRQNDLSTFGALILMVVFIAHLTGCYFIELGMQYPCKIDPLEVQDGETNLADDCTLSWIYANGFEELPIANIYIFAFYWIFEVITTVGYGDYSGSTQNEYIFSIVLEFLGLTFFSFLMGSVSGIFSHSDSFEDLIEEKLD